MIEKKEKLQVEVLVAAMNREPEELAEQMNLDSDAVVINQCDRYGYEQMERKGHRVRFYSCAERGVGRSRNQAIMKADRDICLFSDEDICYWEGYAQQIAEEFAKNPRADMILFQIDVEKDRQTYQITERKRVRWYNCGRYGAVSFAIRTESLFDSGIMFSLLFGGGARYSNGEDSLFLMELIRKGFKVYTAPVSIGWERAGESTWFQGYNRKFFYDRGVLYRYLYHSLALPMAVRFLLAHGGKMCTQVGRKQAFDWMLAGIKGKVMK